MRIDPGPLAQRLGAAGKRGLATALLAALGACGGGSHGGSGGGTVSQAPAAPTVAVAPASASVTTAQPLAVSVTVSGSGVAGVPAGTVTLTSGGFSSGAVTLNAGAASISVPAGVLAIPTGGATAADTLNVTYTPSSAAAAAYVQASGAATVTVSNAVAPTVTATSASVATSGFPSQALPIGSNVLVSVTNANAQTGLDVFTASSPAQLAFKCTQAAASGVSAVEGFAALPNKLDLALAGEDAGADILDAVAAAANCGGSQHLISQGQVNPATKRGPGAFAVTITPDGKYAFVANEYNVVANDSTGAMIEGSVAVVALSYDATGHEVGGTVTGQFSTGGNTIANVTLSPDGTRLYVTSEIEQPGAVFSGMSNSTLFHTGCLQGAASTPRNFGLLSVVDVAKAEASPTASSIIATVAAGCSPVRVVETADQQVIWVAARGDNRVLAFSTHMLESNPDNALLGFGDTGGVAPVGLQLFHDGQLLAVANSNRFSGPEGGIPIDNGNMSIMSATPVNPTVLQKVSALKFPRNISEAVDDATLYLTDYYSDTLQIITTAVR